MQKYGVICADPPWSFKDGLKMSAVKRGASSHYRTLTLQDIINLPVRDLAADVSVLALWCPSTMLADGLRVMSSWGFVQKQVVVWPKKKLGMGHLFRNRHELALVGTRGRYKRVLRLRNQSTLLPTADRPHSVKPEDLQDRLELMLPGPYLELFARRDRPGWTCLGNESPQTSDEDIRDSITRLLAAPVLAVEQSSVTE